MVLLQCLIAIVILFLLGLLVGSFETPSRLIDSGVLPIAVGIGYVLGVGALEVGKRIAK